LALKHTPQPTPFGGFSFLASHSIPQSAVRLRVSFLLATLPLRFLFRIKAFLHRVRFQTLNGIGTEEIEVAIRLPYTVIVPEIVLAFHEAEFFLKVGVQLFR